MAGESGSPSARGSANVRRYQTGANWRESSSSKPKLSGTTTLRHGTSLGGPCAACSPATETMGRHRRRPTVPSGPTATPRCGRCPRVRPPGATADHESGRAVATGSNSECGATGAGAGRGRFAADSRSVMRRPGAVSGPAPSTAGTSKASASSPARPGTGRPSRARRSRPARGTSATTQPPNPAPVRRAPIAPCSTSRSTARSSWGVETS